MKRDDKGKFVGGESYWKGKKFPYSYRKKLSDAHKKIGDKPPSRLGVEPWNKGLKGFLSGSKNGMWKGDLVGYSGVHYWVNKILGKPKECKECGKNEGRIEWANISKEYQREIKDWVSLCKSCHAIFDNVGYKSWEKRRSNALGKFLG